MRCDLITPAARLQKATKLVQERWLATRADWDDAVADRFQERYLDPIVPKMQLTLAAIHELKAVLDEAIRDTSDDSF